MVKDRGPFLFWMLNERVPLPRPSCLMCAESYAWGESGDNTCPENAARIGVSASGRCDGEGLGWCLVRG